MTIKTSVPRIVNVQYKNVVRPNGFAINDLHLEMRRKIDTLCNQIDSDPTGYLICVIGKDTNKHLARAYNFTDKCPVGIWQAVEIIRNSA